MEVYVGQFTEDDLKNGVDKKKIAEAKKENNLKYVNTKLVKKGGKIVAMKVWVCDFDSFVL